MDFSFSAMLIVGALKLAAPFLCHALPPPSYFVVPKVLLTRFDI